MAGILANSASKAMTSGDTAVDKAVTGYIRAERITLTTSPTGTTYQWTLTGPTGSSAAKCSLTDATIASPSFVPDVAGTYSVGVDVDGTTYAIRIGALAVSVSSPVEALRLEPFADNQIPTPTQGSIAYHSSTQGKPSFKDSDGTVHKIGTEGFEYGGMYISAPAATSLSANTWTKAAGTTTLGLANNFDMPANNRLRHTDEEAETYLVMATFSMTSSGNNQTVDFGLSVDGATPDAKTIQTRLLATGSDSGIGACQALIDLSQNSYVELWVRNRTSTASVTIGSLNITAIKVA